MQQQDLVTPMKYNSQARNQVIAKYTLRQQQIPDVLFPVSSRGVKFKNVEPTHIASSCIFPNSSIRIFGEASTMWTYSRFRNLGTRQSS